MPHTRLSGPVTEEETKTETPEERQARVEKMQNSLLDAGKSLGVAPARSIRGVIDGSEVDIKLQVTNDIGGSFRGRGLAATQDLPAGLRVAEFEFTLSNNKRAVAKNRHLFSGYSWHWNKDVVAHLHRPRIGFLGCLTNCALPNDPGREKNNCTISQSHSNRRIFLRTKTKIRRGCELLASYSAAHTRELARSRDIEEVEKEENERDVEIVKWIECKGGGFLKCPICFRGFNSNRKISAHELSSPCFRDRPDAVGRAAAAGGAVAAAAAAAAVMAVASGAGAAGEVAVRAGPGGERSGKKRTLEAADLIASTVSKKRTRAQPAAALAQMQTPPAKSLPKQLYPVVGITVFASQLPGRSKINMATVLEIGFGSKRGEALVRWHDTGAFASLEEWLPANSLHMEVVTEARSLRSAPPSESPEWKGPARTNCRRREN